MQCRVCGAPLPAGANACPSCGNVVQTPGNNPQGQLPPTAYGAPPPPPANYGSAPTPPPPAYPSDPYQKTVQSGPSYPTDPYLQPGQQYPASGSYNQPINNPQPGGPSYPAGPAAPFQPPRKKSRIGLILAIIAVVVIIACIGSVVAANRFVASNTDNATPVATSHSTSTTNSTPTTTNAQPGSSPSGATIDTTASQIITNPQTAGDVDKDTLKPVSGTIAKTFKVNKPIYVTFNLDPNKYDIAKTPAWVNVRFYRGSESILKDDPLQVTSRVTVGYFGAKYYLPTSDGAAEIYWCNTKTCSDGKLAQVVHFTVTA